MQHRVNKELFDFLEKIYELRINNQSSAVESIEAKAGQLLAGVGIFLPLALALIINSMQIQVNFWIILGCITSLLCIVSSGFVLWAKQFKIRPKLSSFYDDSKDLTTPEMRKEALKDMHKALEDNNKSQRSKGLAFNLTVIMFCASVLFISWGILVQKVSFSYNSPHPSTKQSYGKQSKQPTKSTTRPTATAKPKPESKQ